MRPNPGTYLCYPGERVISESKSGLPMLVMDCIIDDQTSIKSYSVLVNKDGSLNDRNIDTLKELFGWDGADPFWLSESDLSGCQMEIVVESEMYDGKPSSSVKWLNVPGKGKKEVEQVDKRDFMAKFGAAFRANATPGGNKPATNNATIPAQEAQGVVLPETATPGTMESAWNALCECKKGTPREQVEAEWHKITALVGKPTASFSDIDWGRVEQGIKDYYDEVPM